MSQTADPPASQAGTQGSQPDAANCSEGDRKLKKARNKNPGVRTQGGRIYDSENGTTCHQCRQKTVEVKAKCTKCTLHWCPRCLLNRYGEEVAKVSKLEEWPCPRCRKLCNCSNCRKRQGLGATGILANLSRAAGFDSVSALLEKNPHAQRPSTPPTSPKGLVRPKQRPGSSLSQASSGSLPLQGSQANGSQPAGSPTAAAKKRPGATLNGGNARADLREAGDKDKASRQRSETVSPSKRARATSSASPAKLAVQGGSASQSPGKPSQPAMQPAANNPRSPAPDTATNGTGGQPKQVKKAGRAAAGGGFRKPPPLLLNPKARALADVSPSAAAAAAAAGQGAGDGIVAADGVQMSNPALMKAAKKQRTQQELVHEAEIGPPPQPMPALRCLALYVGGNGATPTPMPTGCCPGDLAEILEFLQAFGKALQLQWVQPGDLAAQLLGSGPPGATGGVKPRGRSADAPVVALHTALLDMVRCNCIKVADAHEEPVCGKGPDTWQHRFAPWLACVAAGSGSGAALTAAPSRTLPSLHKPGGVMAAGSQGGGGSRFDGSDCLTVLQGKAASFAEALISPGAGSDPAVRAAAQLGYWGHGPAARLRALLELCRDALDCWQLRSYMESEAESAAAAARSAREAKAAARKDARAEWREARDKELALLLAGCGEGGLSAEQQRELTAAAATKADAAAAAASAGAGDAAAAAATSAAVRIRPLGCDRSGAIYYDIGCARLLAGSRQLLVDQEGPGSSHQFGSHPDAEAVSRALDGNGCNEAPLLKRIAAAKFPALDPDLPCSAAALPPPPPLPVSALRAPAAAAAKLDATVGGAAAPAAAASSGDSGATAPVAVPSSGGDTSSPTAPLPAASDSADAARGPDVASNEAQSPVVLRVAAAAPDDGSPARHLTGLPPAKRERSLADVMAAALPSPPPKSAAQATPAKAAVAPGRKAAAKPAAATPGTPAAQAAAAAGAVSRQSPTSSRKRKAAVGSPLAGTPAAKAARNGRGASCSAAAAVASPIPAY